VSAEPDNDSAMGFAVAMSGAREITMIAAAEARLAPST
jgi:hypothetical protein